MSPASIRNLILRVLKLAEPYPLPFAQVVAECNLQARPALDEALVAQHLGWLKEIRCVDSIADPLDPANATTARWLITEPGLAALRK